LYFQYLEESGLTHGLKSWLVRWSLHRLRAWDSVTAQRVDTFVANSHYIARRIRKVWGREAQVVYPPVATQHFSLQEDKDDYYFTAARLVPYKKVDLIVKAFSQMPNKKLIVAGDGPQMKQVRAAAGPNIEIRPTVPFHELIELMRHAKAFVYAAEEDFGITIVEAQACGTPVIAFGKGGAVETVMDGKTGLHFPHQTAESIIAAVRSFERTSARFEPAYIREHALQFTEAQFRARFNAVLLENKARYESGMR
jgi:glycosyltransferase involved in cell wall biosynthesis